MDDAALHLEGSGSLKLAQQAKFRLKLGLHVSFCTDFSLRILVGLASWIQGGKWAWAEFWLAATFTAHKGMDTHGLPRLHC